VHRAAPGLSAAGTDNVDAAAAADHTAAADAGPYNAAADAEGTNTPPARGYST